ncbi:ABC transporter permease [Mesoaciditoga sp.]
MKTLIGIAALLLAWQIISLMIGATLILPTPYQTFEALIKLFGEVETFSAILSTIWKSFLTLLLVMGIGIPIGVVMGSNDSLYEFIRPGVMVIQSVPIISWLALVIFLWGIGWKGPILISFLSLLPTAIFTSASGMKNVDKSLLEMAKVYNVSKKDVLKDVYIGSIMPFILATFEVSVGSVWKVMIMAEYLCGGSGIGVLISWARQYVDVPQIYALTLIAVIIGLSTERISRFYAKKAFKKWELSL